ncbi:MAG: nucleotidyl transferase AbiEii/AbiGii toxin family protein, partial [Bacteroidales bacterium]|nr:nucleotidyl transferase AbiEii/AbiGii toxin family protein [Bacteroidales bacterium]
MCREAPYIKNPQPASFHHFITNIAKSIRARLLNIARAENKTFQLILIRYFHERFLYRLSISQFCRNFILKGGTLLYIYYREKTRPTKDIDFLGLNIPNQTISLKKVFSEICSIDYPYDGVKFYVESIMVEEIADHEEYQGIRLLIDASLDTAIQKLQIDVGFGDIMIPDPVDLKYPVFFPDLYSPIIRAYSPETVIAEKFEAMIDLSVINSRMKDFYDVYQ